MCMWSDLALCVIQVTPRTTQMTFRTERHVPRLGVMLVGWGGNNGTTVTAAVLANKLGITWKTKTGVKVREVMSCTETDLLLPLLSTDLGVETPLKEDEH